MSYFGHWPSYKLAPLRGVKELLYKLARNSWKIDRIGVPLLIIPTIVIHQLAKQEKLSIKERKNPYSEIIRQRQKEGVYKGDLVNIRPHSYA